MSVCGGRGVGRWVGEWVGGRASECICMVGSVLARR